MLYIVEKSELSKIVKKIKDDDKLLVYLPDNLIELGFFSITKILSVETEFISKTELIPLIKELADKNIKYELILSPEKDIKNTVKSLVEFVLSKTVKTKDIQSVEKQKENSSIDTAGNEFLIEEETAIPEKKKRGRKPKNVQPIEEQIKTAYTNHDISENVDQEETIVPEKKKRGRKPKNVQLVDEQLEAVCVNDASIENIEHEETVIPEKKKRGRKPKCLIQDKTIADDSEEDSKKTDSPNLPVEEKTLSREEEQMALLNEMCACSQNSVLNKLDLADKKLLLEAINSSFDFVINFKLVLNTKMNKKIVEKIWPDMQSIYYKIRSI